MNQVQVGQKTHQMRPQDGFTLRTLSPSPRPSGRSDFMKGSSEAELAASVGTLFHF